MITVNCVKLGIRKLGGSGGILCEEVRESQLMHIYQIKVFSREVTLGLKASEGGCWHNSGRSATFGCGMRTGTKPDHQESSWEDAFLLAFFS